MCCTRSGAKPRRVPLINNTLNFISYRCRGALRWYARKRGVHVRLFASQKYAQLISNDRYSTSSNLVLEPVALGLSNGWSGPYLFALFCVNTNLHPDRVNKCRTRCIGNQHGCTELWPFVLTCSVAVAMYWLPDMISAVL